MRSAIGLGWPLVLFFVGACGAAGDDAGEDVDSEEFAASCPAGSTVKGVDVSQWQGQINWGSVKNAGIKFGIARVSDGKSFIDSRFASNWPKMKSAGIVRGAYQFFRPGQDPIAQANVLIQRIDAAGGLDAGDLPPTLDLEVSDGVSDATVIKRAHAWLEKVKAATGKTPMIYTSPGFWSQLGKPASFSQYPLWVANWGVSCPGLPGGSWSKWKLWQYSDSGSVAGISGGVDVNRFNGSLSDLLAFASSGGETPRKRGAAAVSTVEGRIDVFARGEDDHLEHRWFDGEWHEWQDVGGTITSDPTAVSPEEGRIDVFARGGSDQLVHRTLDQDGWSDWEHLGGTLTSAPAAASWQPGRIDVFARGGEKDLVHKWLTADGWQGWEHLGGKLASGPAVVSWAPGRLDVFARSMGDDLVHKWFESGKGWKGWENLGGTITSSPVAVSWQEDRLDVFARGSSDQLVHKWFTSGGWQPWEKLDGKLHSNVGAASWGVGRIDVFARGGGDDLVHKTFAKGEGWSSWEHLGDMP